MADPIYPKPPIWLIIDGTNCVHRDFFGVGNDPAKVADTFERRIAEMIDHWQPACVVAAWDSGPSFRNGIYPDYKAGRKKPEGISEAIAATQLRCTTMGIGKIIVGGYEADDILATLSDEGRADGCRVVIYSNDRDLHQMISGGEVTQLLKVTRVRGGNNKRFDFTFRTAKDLMVEFDVRPDQWVEYKCLVGDPSDNILGFANIGPTTAGRLLRDCGSLDEFYKNPFKTGLTDHQRAICFNHKPYLPLLRELCTLRRDVPLPEFWREGC